MTTFQKWLDRIDNLLEVQKFSGEDTISASFTRRELIELKMMIGVASENGEEWNGFNKSVIAPKGTFEKIWEAEEEQEQKMGRWVNGEYCSECGCDVPAYIIDWKWQKDMDAKYCPMCGAKMSESEDTE